MSDPNRHHDTPVELLRWYREAGVDEAICNTPVDRFDQPAKTPVAPPARTPGPRQNPTEDRMTGSRPGASTLDTDNQTFDARNAAQACASLDELRTVLETFDGLSIKKTAKSLVFGAGNREADVMFIGEAPGRDEDLEGVPFVGRSGQLLDKMLAAIGRDRSDSYITNVIPWRPPGNRSPTPAETAICRPFIDRHIDLVAPRVLVFLGGVAAKEMLSVTTGIMRLRGQWHNFPPGEARYRAIATLHPAYLLRQPAHKRLAWQDFLAIKRALAGPDDTAEG